MGKVYLYYLGVRYQNDFFFPNSACHKVVALAVCTTISKNTVKCFTGGRETTLMQARSANLNWGGAETPSERLSTFIYQLCHLSIFFLNFGYYHKHTTNNL